MRARGAAIVAISVDEPDDSRKLARRVGADFPLLHDPGARTAAAYGVRMKDDELAIPAVFVIRPDGRIIWSHVGETMADRPTVESVLATLGAP